MSAIGDLLQKVREVRYNIGAPIYPGYRMTERSRKHWDQHEAKKAKMQKEWAERDVQMRRQKVVDRARRMIEWSHTEYELAKKKHQHNIKTFTELTLSWSPERVATKHKDFRGLCTALKDETTWRMLSRKERAFIADACK